jgi:hypothetical protein
MTADVRPHPFRIFSVQSPGSETQTTKLLKSLALPRGLEPLFSP